MRVTMWVLVGHFFRPILVLEDDPKYRLCAFTPVPGGPGDVCIPNLGSVLYLMILSPVYNADDR